MPRPGGKRKCGTETDAVWGKLTGGADSHPREPLAEVWAFTQWLMAASGQWLCNEGVADIVTAGSREGIYKEEKSSWCCIRDQAGPGP